MPDTIRIIGMQFYAHHGADAGERALGQRFEVDVELHLDVSEAGRADRLDRTVDYREVYQVVDEVMRTPRLLIEAVAESIAEAVLSRGDVAAVTVRVRKPSVPLGGVVEHVEVEIDRRGG